MENRMNGNFKIIAAFDCGECEIVIGNNPKNFTPWATWRCNNGNDYVIGNYFTEKDSAYADFFRRCMVELGIPAKKALGPSDRYGVYMDYLRDSVSGTVENYISENYTKFNDIGEFRRMEIVDAITGNIMTKIEDLDIDVVSEDDLGYEIDDEIIYDGDYEDIKEDD